MLFEILSFFVSNEYVMLGINLSYFISLPIAIKIPHSLWSLNKKIYFTIVNKLVNKLTSLLI